MPLARPETAFLPVPLVFFRDKEDTVPDPQNSSWGLVVQLLTELDYVQICPCTRADGPQKCVGKNCPYKSHPTDDNPMAWCPIEIEGRRLDKNVRFTSLLTLDFDVLSSEAAATARHALSTYEHCLHTTHNHGVDGAICFRAVVLLSRKVHANEWHRFLAASIEYMKVTVVSLEKKQQPDRVCKDRARLFYRPSRPSDAAFESSYTAGKILDVDEVLAWANINMPDIFSEDGRKSAPLPETSAWNLEGDAVLAAIDIGGRFFPANRRHELCMAVAGMLRKAGATQEDAKYIVYEIAKEGGSDDPETRAKTVDHTYALTDDSLMTGFTRVAEIIGEDAAKELGEQFLEARYEMLPFLAERAAAASTLLPPLPALPAHSTENTSFDLSTLRESLSKLAARRSRSTDRDSKIDGIIFRRALQGKPLAMPGGLNDVETIYEESENRDRGILPEDATRKVVGALAYILPLNTPWEAAYQLLRSSLAQTEVTVEFAEKHYSKAQKKRAIDEFNRQKERSDQAERVANSVEPSSEPPLDGDDWQKLLVKNGEGKIQANGYNISLILRNHPAFRGKIRFNDVTREIENSCSKDDDTDNLTTFIQDFLVGSMDFAVDWYAIRRRVIKTAQENTFDPIKDYLLGLKWDRVPRLSNWLAVYCGATAFKKSNEDQNEARYIQAIGKRWMIATVARALKPGCKVDTMLILESETQGRGKSSAFRCLGGQWFCETPIDVHSKDSRMLVGHNWIFEMAELQGFRTADFDSMKAFLSMQEDWVRVPFATANKKFPRRAIFGATTNRRVYLTDDTGNRRYWSVYVKKIRYGALERDRDQLFAEAVHLFLAANVCPECALARADDSRGRCHEHRWWLTEEEEKLAEEESSKREEDVPCLTQIHEWWLNLPSHERPQKLNCEDVATGVLKLSVDRITERVRRQIGIAMGKLGFKAQRIMVDSVRHQFYIPDQKLLDAKQIKKVERVGRTTILAKVVPPSVPPPIPKEN